MILGGKNEKTNCNENGECSTHRRNDRWISRLWKWRKGSSQSAADSRTKIESDSPYANQDFDLSKHETIVMYVLGDKPKDMDEVLDKANADYFEPNLNTTLDLEF